MGAVQTEILPQKYRREMLVASIKMEAGEKGSVAFGIHSDSVAQANVTFKISTGVVSSESPRLQSIATFHYDQPFGPLVQCFSMCPHLVTTQGT